MPEIFELSAYETSAELFFETLKQHHTDLVLDVRLKNSNQLCGFTKEKDLAYLVPAITGARYCHDLAFAPSPSLLDAYLHHVINWETYSRWYQKEIAETHAIDHYQNEYGNYQHICILGTATRKRRSHSEVLIRLLSSKNCETGRQ